MKMKTYCAVVVALIVAFSTQNLFSYPFEIINRSYYTIKAKLDIIAGKDKTGRIIPSMNEGGIDSYQFPVDYCVRGIEIRNTKGKKVGYVKIPISKNQCKGHTIEVRKDGSIKLLK